MHSPVSLTWLGLEEAVAHIIAGDRDTLATLLPVDVELPSQRMDHNRQVPLPHLPQGTGSGPALPPLSQGTERPLASQAGATMPITHQDEVSLVCGEHQHRDMVLGQRCNDRPGDLGDTGGLAAGGFPPVGDDTEHQPCGICHLHELGGWQLCEGQGTLRQVAPQGSPQPDTEPVPARALHVTLSPG